MSRSSKEIQQSIFNALKEGTDCENETGDEPIEESEKVKEAFFQDVDESDNGFKLSALVGQSQIITQLFVKNMGGKGFEIPLQSYPAIFKAVAQGSSNPEDVYRVEELAFGNKGYPIFFTPSGIAYGRGKPEKAVPTNQSRYKLIYVGKLNPGLVKIISDAKKKPLIDNDK